MTQVFVNILISASIYALIGISFSMIYSTARFFHFAHGAIFTYGAYGAWFAKIYLGLPILFSVCSGAVVASTIGVGLELLLYSPLRRKGTRPLALLLVSLGVYVVLQNVLSLTFGDETKSLAFGNIRMGMSVMGVRITVVQLTSICTATFVIAGISFVMRKTKFGKSLRALADNSDLAAISGINIDRIMIFAFLTSSALAGLAGMLAAADTYITPVMGLNALMMGVVSVFIGGIGRLNAVALGALLLALAQNFGAWFAGAQWQESIAFFVLLTVLLFKPEGVWGKKIKEVTV